MTICPSCGSINISQEWMMDCGEEVKIKKCKDCGWYGEAE